MEFSKVLQERHSVRNFENQHISEDKMRRILEAARLAPSWTNEQCWRFVVVEDSEIKERVAEAVPDSNPAKNALKEAPVIVVLCADPDRSGDVAMKEYYMVDAGIAMEHLVLAAVNEGLGTCWVGVFNEDEIREILDVPRRYRVVAMTPIGYPGKHSDSRERKPLSDIAYENTWENPVRYLH